MLFFFILYLKLKNLRMKFQLYTIYILVVFVGCKTPERKSLKADNNDVERVSNTDSLVVETLIQQSREYFNDKKNVAEPFDNYLTEAIELAEKSDLKVPMAQIYNIVGKRYRNCSLYGESMECYQKALTIAKDLKREDLLAFYYNQIGVVYRRVDENTLALDMHLKALKIAEAIQDSFIIEVALNGIGNVNFNLTRYHSSIEYFKKSFKVADAAGNGLGRAINYNNIGDSWLQLNEPDTALQYFVLSLEENRKIESQIGEAICYNGIGDAYIAKGQMQQAMFYLEKALKINLEEGDMMQIATSCMHIGEIYLESGKLPQAFENLKKGQRIAKKIGSRYLMEESSRLLSKAYEVKGDFKAALAFQKLSSTYKDTLLNEKNMHYLSTMEATLASEKQQGQIGLLNQERQVQETLIAQQKMMIFSGALLVGVLIFVIALIMRQNRLRNRYRILHYQQRLLRTQMNPHFIFNALSAIQVFILENDMEKSVRFLSDFSKLMRQVLRSSNRDYISLKDELEVIKYYLDIQKLRFNVPFKYHIKVDESLDLDTVMVPPMLTQPFLENAIEHGFGNMDDEGQLLVSFMKEAEQETLLINVDDNGIGIEQSKSERSNSKKHESMALKITKERLEVLKKDARRPTSFSIKDKRQDNPFDRGTLVSFGLPLIVFKRNN
ncbi:histidine kinase [Marinilabiliaceae bacterium JC017]|nr:histidine kinase [Marinilabiliaceae bacterium JC017]